MIAAFQRPVIASVTPALVTLAAGWATREGASIDQSDIRRSAEIARPHRSAYVTPNDRGLNEIEITFSVVKQFTTEALALAYIVALPPLVDCSAGDTVKSGTLAFTNETDASVFQLINAVCQQITPKKMGVSLLITYRFVGSYWHTP